MVTVDDSLKEVFPENTDEYKTITDCYKLITDRVPTLSSEIKLQMEALDQMKMKLSSIYYMLTNNISKKKSENQQSYDAQYTRLVRQGRPSNTAIEAEIRATNSDYASNSLIIEQYTQIKDLISSYLKCIDSCKQTAIEMLRDSRRID